MSGEVSSGGTEITIKEEPQVVAPNLVEIPVYIQAPALWDFEKGVQLQLCPSQDESSKANALNTPVYRLFPQAEGNASGTVASGTVAAPGGTVAVPGGTVAAPSGAVASSGGIIQVAATNPGDKENAQQVPVVYSLVPISDNMLFSCNQCGETLKGESEVTNHKCNVTVITTTSLEVPDSTIATTTTAVAPQPIATVHNSSAVVTTNSSVQEMPSLENGGSPKKKKKSECVCQECGKVFGAPWHLKRHSYLHSGTRPFKCQFCPKGFCEQNKLNAHLFVHHSDEWKKQKEQANRPTAEKTDSSNEFMAASNEDDDDSGLASVQQEQQQLDRLTVVKVEIQEAPQVKQEDTSVMIEYDFGKKCPVCGVMFPENEELSQHIVTHAGINPQKCSYCDKEFVLQEELSQHEESVHGMPDDESAKSVPATSSSGSSKAAITKRTQSTLGKNLVAKTCFKCGKMFSKPSDLKRHMYTHSGDRPFKCDKCGKGFIEMNKLKHHQFTHTKKPYQCHVCRRQFPNEGAFRKHKLGFGQCI